MDKYAATMLDLEYIIITACQFRLADRSLANHHTNRHIFNNGSRCTRGRSSITDAGRRCGSRIVLNGHSPHGGGHVEVILFDDAFEAMDSNELLYQRI
jgi:hypothetical protein